MSIDRALAVGGVIVGLVGTGIVVLWPGKRWVGWIFIAVALLIALLSIVWALAVSHARKEFEDSHTKSLRSSNASTPLAQAGIDFKPHIEVKPTFNQTQAPSQEQSHRQSDLARFKDTKLHFQCVAAEFIDVQISELTHEIMPEPNWEAIPAKAAIAEFRRNADEPAIESINIRTQIELHPPDKPGLIIQKGRWLGRGKDRIATDVGFRIQTTRRLAIVLAAQGRYRTYEGFYRARLVYGMQIPEFVYEFQELTEPKYEVEVHLFGFQKDTGVTVNERMHFELLIPEMVFRLKSN